MDGEGETRPLGMRIHARGKRQPPVIQIADRANGLLSFNNLSELHVLSALRGHEVPLQRIGRVKTLREKFVGDHPHPLLALDMQTDGLSIFIEHLGLVNITRHGQGALREVFEAHLKRFERDPNRGTALRLFPFGTAAAGCRAPSGAATTVSIDPRVSFGRPVLAVPVSPLWSSPIDSAPASPWRRSLRT